MLCVGDGNRVFGLSYLTIQRIDIATDKLRLAAIICSIVLNLTIENYLVVDLDLVYIFELSILQVITTESIQFYICIVVTLDGCNLEVCITICSINLLNIGNITLHIDFC